MSKRNLEDFCLKQNLTLVKKSKNWNIFQDSHYFYKVLQEQNIYALGKTMQMNLEYMMDPENYVPGVNPVSDIYYVDENFFAYRTKRVEGKTILQLSECFRYDLEKWLPFFFSLWQTLSLGMEKGYCFPDLFTNGNILYQEESQRVVFIDNDGMQIQNRFVGLADLFGSFLIFGNDNMKVLEKYFDFQGSFFYEDYMPFSFYSWFFSYFFQVNLPNLLLRSELFSDPTKEIDAVLKRIHFPMNTDFASRIFDLFLPNVKNQVHLEDFIILAQKYMVVESNLSRSLKLKLK